MVFAYALLSWNCFPFLSRWNGSSVNPSLLPGEYDGFVSGNDSDAIAQDTDLIRNGFGWKSVITLGDMTTARAAEIMMIFWLNMRRMLRTSMFNYKVVH